MADGSIAMGVARGRASRSLRGLIATFLFTMAIPASAMSLQVGIVADGLDVASPTAREAAVQQVLATNASTVRVFLPWDSFEPTPGAMDKDGSTYTRWQSYVTSLKELSAAGRKVLIVVVDAPFFANQSSNPHDPPDPGLYAKFMTRVASDLKSASPRYEIWNEPDERKWFTGSPQTYVSILNQAYDAVKAVDPSALVYTGGMTGANVEFYKQIVAAGAKFDVLGVHTDMPCNGAPDDVAERDDAGHISRYVFLGLIELLAEMKRTNNVKLLSITESGWSTYGGACDAGASAGLKPGGVSLENQAIYLSKAHKCVEEYGEGIVTEVITFALNDNGQPGSIGQLGIFGKPAYGAFLDATVGNYRGVECNADLEGPTTKILSPSEGAEFTGPLLIDVAAEDPSGIKRIEIQIDGKKIRNFANTANAAGKHTGSIKCQRLCKGASLGGHKITAIGVDKHGNESETSVMIKKVSTASAAAIKTKIGVTVTFKNGKATVNGVVSAKRVLGNILGKVSVQFEKMRPKKKGVKGKWVVAHKYLRPAKKPLNITKMLKKAKWRVRIKTVLKKPFTNAKPLVVPLTPGAKIQKTSFG